MSKRQAFENWISLVCVWVCVCVCVRAFALGWILKVRSPVTLMYPCERYTCSHTYSPPAYGVHKHSGTYASLLFRLKTALCQLVKILQVLDAAGTLGSLVTAHSHSSWESRRKQSRVAQLLLMQHLTWHFIVNSLIRTQQLSVQLLYNCSKQLSIV